MPTRCCPVANASTANKCVVAGWIYSTIIALFIAFPPPQNNETCPQKACLPVIVNSEYNKVARTGSAISILALILAVTAIQFYTFWRSRKRLKCSVGCATNQGLNRLLKRAMKKSVLVALAFSIAWGPVGIMIILSSWTDLDELALRKVLPFLNVIVFFQGFSNALIFRAKHLKAFMKKKIC